MMQHHNMSRPDLRDKIARSEICFGGNRNLKIYGRLHCSSGKKIKKDNRVFFRSEGDAKSAGYRPCGNCMKEEYKEWISLKG